MKLDIGLASYDLNAIPEFARQVEAAGYDCLWSSETQHDPFLPLAVAAHTTSSIKLGTSIAVAFPRSPMVLAYTAWDLQNASHGRFILGLGSQVKAHNERRFSVKYDSPAPRMREVVLALRAIWECWQNGTPLKFEGQFYRFTLMTPFFDPGPIEHPDIPVYIAGVNRHMCRVSGEVCRGLHVHPFHTAKYLRECIHPAVKEGLRSSGRSRKDFSYCSSVFVVLGDTDSERDSIAQAVKQQIAFYASTRTYQPVLEVHGWENIAAELHRKSLRGDWNEMADLITDEMLNEIAIIGTYNDVGKKLRQRYAGLLDRVALYDQSFKASDPRLLRLARELSS